MFRRRSNLRHSDTSFVFFFSPIFRIYSSNRPVRFLNFWTLRVGAYSRLGAYYIFTIFSNCTMFIKKHQWNTRWENLISSHVKITCYLHMWKYRLCYGYIIYRAFHTKKLLKWNDLVIHWCLYLALKKYFTSEPANEWNIILQSKRNFVSPRGHVISSIYFATKQEMVITKPKDLTK